MVSSDVLNTQWQLPWGCFFGNSNFSVSSAWGVVCTITPVALGSQCPGVSILPFFAFQKLYTIYGAKPIYAPENLDSFASLTLYARFARYPNSLPACGAYAWTANPIPMLVSLQLRFVRSNFACAAGFACAQAAAIYWNPVSAFHRLVFAQ